MLLFLIKFFNIINVPAVFSYCSTRMLLAAVTSLCFVIFLGPKFIRKLYELKIGQPIRGKGECPLLAELHEKKKDTPTMGGVLILSSMVCSLFLWMDLSNVFTIVLLFVTVVLGGLGALDDYRKLKRKSSKGISPRFKFSVQFFCAGIIVIYFLCFGSGLDVKTKAVSSPVVKEKVMKTEMKTLSAKEYMTRIYVPFLKDHVVAIGGVALFLFLVFVIVGSSNAVNLTDGLDGLAAGCLLPVALVFALIAFLSNNIETAKYLNILYMEGSGEIGVYLFALTGACLGFLWYNGHPAQLFMGDTGSLALGGIIGVSAVLLKREVLLALIGGVFVMEALSVILQVFSYRFFNKKRIFLCAPLHHHFEYKGWSEIKVVLRFWIISLLLAMIGVASLKFQ